MIPFFLLQSKESTITSKKITPAVLNDKQLARVISHSEKNKNIDNNNLSDSKHIVPNTSQSSIITEKHEAIHENIEQKNNPNTALQAPLANNDKLNFETPISIKKIVQVDTHNLQQNKLLSYFSNYSKTKLDNNSKKTDASKKPKKISRTKILAPHINYNGF